MLCVTGVSAQSPHCRQAHYRTARAEQPAGENAAWRVLVRPDQLEQPFFKGYYVGYQRGLSGLLAGGNGQITGKRVQCRWLGSDPKYIRPIGGKSAAIFIQRHPPMALRATIYKVDLHIADNDRGYYGSHSVTVARHPSETDERMMVRLLAYALFADSDDSLEFTRGLSATEEPDLWRKDLTGAITQWIEAGLPDERRLLKACGKSEEVIVIAYGRNTGVWWQGVRDRLERADNLRVYALAAEETAVLAGLATRKMTLNINVSDAAAWLSDEVGEATLQVQKLR